MTALAPHKADIGKEMLIGGISNTFFNGAWAGCLAALLTPPTLILAWQEA